MDLAQAITQALAAKLAEQAAQSQPQNQTKPRVKVDPTKPKKEFTFMYEDWLEIESRMQARRDAEEEALRRFIEMMRTKKKTEKTKKHNWLQEGF